MSSANRPDRDAVLARVGRADMAAQLQSLGVDPRKALERVAAMSDDEVRTLGGQLDILPAGARVGEPYSQ